MKKLVALLLISTLATSASAADMFTIAVNEPVNIRYGRVYNLAKLSCPTAVDTLSQKSTPATREDLEPLMEITRMSSLTKHESSLFLQMCEMYALGVTKRR